MTARLFAASGREAYRQSSPLRTILKYFAGLLLFLFASQLHAQKMDAVGASNLVHRAWSELDSNHFTSAETLFRSAALSQSDNPSVLRGLAMSLYQLKKYDQAIDAYWQLLEIKPYETNAYLYLGVSYYDLEQYQRAETSCRQYVTLNPGDPAGYDWLSQSQIGQEDYTNALPAIRQATALNPTNAGYYYSLGYCLGKLNRDQEAVKALNQALSLEPQNTNILASLGFEYFRLMDYPRAIKLYRQLISLNTSNATATYLLARCYYNSRNFSEAVECLQQDVSQEPTNFNGFYWLGYSFWEMHRYQEASGAFQKALQINPEDFSANRGCALTLLVAAQWKEAIPYAKRMHEIRTKDRFAWQLLFELYLVSGQYKQAYEVYPRFFVLGGGLLLLGYFSGLAALLKFSFRIRPNPFPGLWFSLLWTGLFFEGQVACICLLGFLSFVRITETPLSGIILAGLPVIFAAKKGFARQPWGEVFSWPPRLGPPRMMWLSLLGLALLFAFDSGYSALWERITHQPVPGQETVPLINKAFEADPVTAFLSVCVAAPLIEEILFRGLLFGALLKWLPVGGAIATSALLFALVHLQIVYIIPLFFTGVILGWIRSRTGSLGLPVLIHALNNSLSLLMMMAFGNSH